MSRVEPNPNDPNFVADYLKNLEARLRRLEQSALRGIGNLKNPDPWRVVGDPGEPGFATGWDYPVGLSRPRFYRDGFGFVHLAGLAQYSGGGTDVVLTLPDDHWPPTLFMFPTIGTVADCMVSVGPDGKVRVTQGSVVGTPPPNGRWSLDVAVARIV